ncbi:MAG: ribose 5-phosphate isomerase B [Chloroflexi bacterium]|nr:ribose 5-phosphate isomerase B [Chloroflexota bacterium]
MRIAIGADHNGLASKNEVKQWLELAGHTVVDVGPHELDPYDDYPDFARLLGAALQRGEADRGILLCGSGVGASIAANKMRGIRAGLCHDVYSAHQAVEHDNVNVLCLGPRVVGPALMEELVTAFLAASFTGEERHARRLAKVTALEQAEREAGLGQQEEVETT